MQLSSLGRIGLVPGLLLLAIGVSIAETKEPLHRRIDQLVAAGNVAPVASRAGNAEFLRRIYLDLTGTIPSAAETRKFLADKTPDKRAKLIDRLLASEYYVHHLATTFDVWLMERRKETHVKTPEWRKFLAESFAANKPYNVLVGEILAADGTEAKNRAAARFFLDRDGEPNLLTRDVGRIFFGQDLQCAQCHDHPNITEYLQRDYYGMLAFFNRTYLFQPDKKKPAVLAEKAEAADGFKSVFTEVEGAELPRVLHSAAKIADPEFPPGEEYEVAPDPKKKTLQPIPKYSRRDRIAKAATESNNPAFNRNVTNRLWAHLMGRGLVAPFDFHHASNPPTHPELLDLLATEFAAMKYDIRAFLRELALTETYQRSFEMPATLAQQANQVRPELASLQASEGQLAGLARAAADELDAAKTAWNESRKVAAPHEAKLAESDKKRVAAALALKKANDALAVSKVALDKVTTTTQEGQKPDPKTAKLEADVAAKQKAADAAKTALAAAAAEAEKYKPPVEAERKKVEAVTQKLDAARQRYAAEKTAWKLAQRKLQDAEALIAYADSLPGASSGADLVTLKQETETLRKLADVLKQAADSAQAARAQLPDDDNLVNAASILGARSAAVQTRAETAAKSLAAKQAAAKIKISSTELSEAAAAALESLTGRWSEAFAVGSFSQLTPEQLCASMLQASGEIEKYPVAGEAEFKKKLAAQEAAKKKAAEAPPEKKDDAKKAPATPVKAPEPLLTEVDREQFVDDYVRNRVTATTTRFVQLFGGQAGLPQTDFFATADQALFLSNDGTVRAWLRPSGENLAGRLMKLEKPADLANELYLSVLTREPDPAELAGITNYLAAKPEKKSEAVQELTWALISSVEFRFKH